jgi:hypothetical protein
MNGSERRFSRHVVDVRVLCLRRLRDQTLSQAVHGDSYAELKKKYTPPLMPDYGVGWFQSFELGHQGYSEFLIWDQDEDTTGVDHFYVDTAKMNIKGRFYTSLLGPHQPLYLTGQNTGPTTTSGY